MATSESVSSLPQALRDPLKGKVDRAVGCLGRILSILTRRLLPSLRTSGDACHGRDYNYSPSLLDSAQIQGRVH